MVSVNEIFKAVLSRAADRLESQHEQILIHLDGRVNGDGVFEHELGFSDRQHEACGFLARLDFDVEDLGDDGVALSIAHCCLEGQNVGVDPSVSAQSFMREIKTHLSDWTHDYSDGNMSAGLHIEDFQVFDFSGLDGMLAGFCSAVDAAALSMRVSNRVNNPTLLTQER